MRLFLSLMMLGIVAGCAVDPTAERGNDESRYTTGSNIPRRNNVTSSDRVERATTIDSGTGIASPR